jgi:hypothetical protein
VGPKIGAIADRYKKCGAVIVIAAGPAAGLEGQPMNHEHHSAVENCLAYQWRSVRGMFIRRALLSSYDLLALINGHVEFDGELRRRADDKIGSMISAAIGKPWGNREMWAAANAVCPDRAKLLEMIGKDDAVRGLDGDVEPREALGRILENHLHARRREILGRSEHEDRVWTIIYKHDKKVKMEHQTRGETPPHQCSDLHFKNIQNSIRSGEHNERVKSIKLRTIRDYFFRFCQKCRNEASGEYTGSSGPEPSNHLPSYLRELMWQKVETCLKHLAEDDRGIICAWLQPDGGAQYCSRENVGPLEFRRQLNAALYRLKSLVQRLGWEE